MNVEETKRTILALTNEWIRLEGLAGDMTYTEYMDLTTGLQAVTRNLERTQFISLVLQQAHALGPHSAWIKAEVRFEIIAAGVGDRSQLLKLAVATQKASDESLDLFNERVNRFTTPG